MLPHFNPSIGLIHFIGIGGHGMCPLAQLMYNLGYKIQGSQIADEPNVTLLRNKGITVFVGHKAENISGAKLIVATSAVGVANPEVIAAHAAGIQIVHRAEMLSELMRWKKSVAVAGCNGKSSTTALVACVLDGVGLNPSVVNGGTITAYNDRFRFGKDSDWLVVETDESDGSFVRMAQNSLAVVVTNLDLDHIGSWPTKESLREGYAAFISAIPFYGLAVVCIDDPAMKELLQKVNRPIIRYGFSEDADVRIRDLVPDNKGSTFSVDIRDRGNGSLLRSIESIRLPVLGEHNVQNATAALAIAVEAGANDSDIKKALGGYQGVNHRFIVLGEVNGVTVVDDFTNHPLASVATIKMAKQAGARNVIPIYDAGSARKLVIQQEYATCFKGCKNVFVIGIVGKVLSECAYEAEVDGVKKTVPIDDDAMMKVLQSENQSNFTLVKMDNAVKDLPALIGKVAEPGDFVVYMGKMPEIAHGVFEGMKKLSS